MIRVVGIKITDRIKEAGIVQRILSEHVSVISSRLGFHELNDEVCSREGFVILHLSGGKDECDALVSDLKSAEGITAEEMVFTSGAAVSPLPEAGATVVGIVFPASGGGGIAVQSLLTMFGNVIRIRLGLNETWYGESARLIILELAGDRTQFLSLEKELRAVGGASIGRICLPA